MQTSVDGFVANAHGHANWMIWSWGEPWTWDKDLQQYHTRLTASIDRVLLSRKMAQEGFIDHWAAVAKKKNNPQAAFAGNVTKAHKIVFTKTLQKSAWPNTTLAKGDLVTTVNQLKQQPGRDMIVYGGASFVSSLVAARLIDEYHLVVNPTALGKGLSIFQQVGDHLNLQLQSANQYPCGVVVLIYTPA